MEWRGFSNIRLGGFELRDSFTEFDAAKKWGLRTPSQSIVSECIAAEIMRGKKKPVECAMFGTRCTPLQPLGAPMVSSEGACAAYYRYRPQSSPGQHLEHTSG